jgi:hypothetical protein
VRLFYALEGRSPYRPSQARKIACAQKSLELPVVSDRLSQLQRQRALLQEHLAWLDREIVAAQSGTKPSVPPASVAAAIVPAGTEALATDILAQYQSDPASVKEDVKKGCFLYFFLAFAVVGVGVLALYLYSTRRL